MSSVRIRSGTPSNDFETTFVSGARPEAFWLRARGMKTGEFNPWGPLARLSARMRGQTVEVTVEANLWRVLDVDIP